MVIATSEGMALIRFSAHASLCAHKRVEALLELGHSAGMALLAKLSEAGDPIAALLDSDPQAAEGFAALMQPGGV